jgi:hypothetical protein
MIFGIFHRAARHLAVERIPISAKASAPIHN